MAERYHIVDGNRGSSVVIEFLKKSGEDLSRFKNSFIGKDRYRRAGVKMSGIKLKPAN